MENLKLFLAGAVHPSCTCYVERREDGTIVKPDLNLCPFTVQSHKAAIDRMADRLERITKEGK